MPRYRQRYYSPTKITINWQQTSQLYALQMHKEPGEAYFPRSHWDQFQQLIKPILLAIPHGSEREYDPETNTWFFVEKYFDSIKACIESLPNFRLEVFAKPEPQTSSGIKIPNIENMKTRFLELTGLPSMPDEFTTAKKAFFRTSMKLHPDKTNNAEPFYQLNEAWQELEIQFYKTKQRVTELKELSEVTYG